MAKKSITARQRKREKLVAQHAEKRAELKKAGDWKALDEMPKNSSKVRLKNSRSEKSKLVIKIL